jgi:uncharacterized protein YndB with AHSA1/START domain
VSIRQQDFTIERRFRQSPEQTFQAFADPDLRQRWFRVPDSWTDTEWSLDFCVGGGELNAGRDDRGTHHHFRSRFHDIVDGERIVFAYDMRLDGRLTSVSLTTIELRHDNGGGTGLIFTERCVPRWSRRAFSSPPPTRKPSDHSVSLQLSGPGTSAAGGRGRRTPGTSVLDSGGNAVRW